MVMHLRNQQYRNVYVTTIAVVAANEVDSRSTLRYAKETVYRYWFSSVITVFDNHLNSLHR